MADRTSLLALHHLALDVSRELMARRNVRAIALTGSCARGDASLGSDVDLWVIGPRTWREQRVVDGTPVTLLWQTPRALNTLDTLYLYEIEDAWVLYDPAALFRRLRSRYWRERERLQRAMVEGTRAVVLHLLASAVAQPAEPALGLLREAGRRAAALFIYMQLGWRVPRWRHFAQHLPRPAMGQLERLLGLPVDDVRFGQVQRLVAALGDDRLLGSPWELQRLVDAGRRHDALIKLREGVFKVPAQARPRPARLALWRALHGLSIQGASLDRDFAASSAAPSPHRSKSNAASPRQHGDSAEAKGLLIDAAQRLGELCLALGTFHDPATWRQVQANLKRLQR